MNNRVENKIVLFESKGSNSDSLNSNDILIAEFNYAMQTASQSNEDRVKIFQFVVANILTIAATLFFSEFAQSDFKKLMAFVFLFFMVFGVISLLQLSRLRLAWIDSVKAMNKIKDYYITQNESLSEAFLWRTSTIPKAKKDLSLAYLLALSLMIINALSTGIALQLIFSNYLVSILGSFIAFVVQLVIWNRVLGK